MTHPTDDLADALDAWANSGHLRDLYQGATPLSETLRQAAANIRACNGGAVQKAMPDAGIQPAYGPILPILADAVQAAEKAMQKYPQPNYVISKWAEETGEVTKALIHAAEGRESWNNIRGEIVQSLAMLHRLMVEGDQVHGLPPLIALAKKGPDHD